MRLTRLRGATSRFIALFALTSIIAVALLTASVLMLDREARRSRAQEAAQRDLSLIADKLKGSLSDPEAGPLLAGIVSDVDAYAGRATGRSLRFDPAVTISGLVVEPEIAGRDADEVGAAIRAPAGRLTVYRRVETSGPLRPALVRYGGFASLLAIAFAVLTGVLVSRWLTGRAAAMNAVFAAVGAGAVNRRVAVTGGPLEFRTLAQNLNVMLDTLERRVTELRLSSDRIAHDLRTPLTKVAARLSSIELSPDPTASRAAETARIEIDALVGTLNALLDLREIETESTMRRERFRLDLAIREAIDLYEAEAEDVHGVAVKTNLFDVEMTGCPPLIVRAVANLIHNALRAAPRGSVVIVTLEQVNNRAVIGVSDAGAGFPADVLSQLNTSGTVRSTWNGHGLGLSIVRAIAERHGGSLTTTRASDRTLVRLNLMISPSSR